MKQLLGLLALLCLSACRCDCPRVPDLATIDAAAPDLRVTMDAAPACIPDGQRCVRDRMPSCCNGIACLDTGLCHKS